MRRLLCLMITMMPMLGAVSQNGQHPKWAGNVSGEQKEVITAILSNMLEIPTGTYWVGNPEHPTPDGSVYDCFHPVRLNAFLLNRYELTGHEYQVIMGTDKVDSSLLNVPVANISWFDCQRFIERISTLSGISFRLPTHAEWQAAASGGKIDNKEKFAGGEPITGYAWLAMNADSVLHQVGTLKPNRMGLYDMTGNVAEWMLDNYSLQYSDSLQVNPLKYNAADPMHMVCGGTVFSDRSGAENYSMQGVNGNLRFSAVGMRLAIGNGVPSYEVVYPKPYNPMDNSIDTTLVKDVSEEDKTHFIKGSWETITGYAKEADKPVFLDCFTSWCGPCRVMDRYVFSTKHIGNYLNRYFVPTKMDMEKGEGKVIASKYGVNVFPTLLILTPDGEELGRMVGLHNVNRLFIGCDSIMKAHPNWDESEFRNPEPKELDSTLYVPGHETKVYRLSWTEAVNKAKEMGLKTIMLDCSTSWCYHCKIQEKYVFPLAPAGDFLNNNCIVNYMDMDSEEGQQFKEKFGIEGYPTYLFLDLDGNEKGRVIGSASVKKMLKMWKRALKGFRTFTDGET